MWYRRFIDGDDDDDDGDNDGDDSDADVNDDNSYDGDDINDNTCCPTNSECYRTNRGWNDHRLLSPGGEESWNDSNITITSIHTYFKLEYIIII